MRKKTTSALAQRQNKNQENKYNEATSRKPNAFFNALGNCKSITPEAIKKIKTDLMSNFPKGTYTAEKESFEDLFYTTLLGDERLGKLITIIILMSKDLSLLESLFNDFFEFSPNEKYDFLTTKTFYELVSKKSATIKQAIESIESIDKSKLKEYQQLCEKYHPDRNSIKTVSSAEIISFFRDPSNTSTTTDSVQEDNTTMRKSTL